MYQFYFPSATNELLAVLQRYGDNPAAIDEYLQKFSVKCAESFLTSLTGSPPLFTKDELLEEMRETNGNQR